MLRGRLIGVRTRAKEDGTYEPNPTPQYALELHIDRKEAAFPVLLLHVC
jgi:hypothetical protein